MQTAKAHPCKYCGTTSEMMVPPQETVCPPCAEFKRRAKTMLERASTMTGFYKIIHEVLEPFQMVCVSKTILPDTSETTMRGD